MVVSIKSVNIKLGKSVTPHIDIFKEITKDNLEGTVIDPRLGTLTTKDVCKSCNQTYTRCPGHKGIIKLNRPIIVAKKASFIVKLLNLFTDATTKKGSLKIAYDLNEIKKIETNNVIERLKQIVKLDKIKRYDYYTGQEGTNFNFKVSPRKKKHEAKFIFDGDYMVDFYDIKELLRKIPSKVLGIVTKQNTKHVSRPENAILEEIIVPSNNVRMDIFYNGKSEHHRFTELLNMIVISNNKLLIAPDEQIPEMVTEIIENFNSIVYNLSDENFSIEKELKEKEGVINRFYGNRGKYAARMTITPSPFLKVNEVSIPSVIANNLTTQDWLLPFVTRVRMPELLNITVDQYDEEKVKQFQHANRRFFNVFNKFFRKGPRDWMIKRINNRAVYNIDNIIYSTYFKDDQYHFVIIVQYDNNKQIELKGGQSYRRILCDGDWVQVSRQPVLHKYGFLGCFIRIHDDSDTMRINLSICKMLGADFDGDTMNLYSPSSIDAKLETMKILNVENNMISDASGGITTGLVQNTLLSIGVFCDEIFTWQEIEDACSTVNVDPEVVRMRLKGQIPQYIGKFLFSCALPEGLYCKHVTNGIYHGPSLNKKVLNTLLKDIYNSRTVSNPGKTMIDINYKLQQIFGHILQTRGYSAGYTASFIGENTKQSLKQLVKDARKINDADGDSLQEEYLKTLKLNTFTSKIVKLVKNDSNVKNDPYIKMIEVGAKGTNMNIAHAFGMIGQQMYKGLRPKFNLPITGKDVSSYGFISHSYFEGLDPKELFIMFICARPGLASNATLTSNTGYLQKRFVSLLTDLITYKDQTVRMPNGNILSFDNNLNIETKGLRCDVKHLKKAKAYVYYTEDNKVDYDLLYDDMVTWIVYNPKLPIFKKKEYKYLPNIGNISFPFEVEEV